MATLSWKERVAEKLSRLLADNLSSPPPPHGDYSPVASEDPQAVFSQEFASPEKSSFSSHISSSSLSNLTTVSVGVREQKPPTHLSSVSSSSWSSLRKRWKGGYFARKDTSSSCTEESRTRSECEEMPQSFKDKMDHFPKTLINGSHVHSEASTLHDPREYLSYLTEKSTFMSADLFEFFQSCLPNIVKGCQWILLYRAAHGNMGYLFARSFVTVLPLQAHAY